MNANKGLKNPLANDIGRTAREYTKEKINEGSKDNRLQPRHEYLYAQVQNGVNVRLAKPHGVTVGRLKNHVFKQSLFEDDSSGSDEKSPVDVHGNREKNQKAFLSYVKDAKAKKEARGEGEKENAQPSEIPRNLTHDKACPGRIGRQYIQEA